MMFTPCDPAQPTCGDVTVGLLQKIFGPIIDVLARGVDPNTVQASSSLLGSMFSYYNTGVLAVASLIISYVATVGTVNTANDGEAMGKHWSAPWTSMRIVTGGFMLLPTASGYSFLQMFVLTLALWSIGFANGLYKIGMTMGIIKTDNIVASSTVVPASTFGLRAFAKQYLPVAYCSHAANAIYTDANGAPAVQTSSRADRVSTVNGRVEYTFFIKDRNPVTNLAGGEPICGTVKLSTYTSQEAADATGTSTAIATLHSGLSVAKAQAAMGLMADINAWVATMPTDITKSGWGIESKNFNNIVKQREDALAGQIEAQVLGGTTNINNGISTFVDQLTKGGWAMAGGWYQRVGAIRRQLGSAVTETVGNASEPSLSALPDDARAQLLRSSVAVISEGVIKKSEEPGNGYDLTAAPAADIANSLPKSAVGDINIGAVQQDIQSKFGSFVNNMMKETVDIATGSSVDVDAVSRMKMVGDSLVLAMASAEIAEATLTSSVAVVRSAVAGIGGVQILGTKVDASGSMAALWDWMMVGPIKQLDKLIGYIEPLAFYFSVFLPSLPYTIFMITVVGWGLGVLQTVIAAPLWAVMHMRPSQTFIGSDSQGYLLLLALFVRPALAIIGLFAAMLLADPVVDYIAQAFFAMRGAVVTSTGLFPGAFVEFLTFAWWMVAFGLVLLPVLYMVYSLPQVLPDHVLKWINAGVHDLGATAATSNLRGGLAMNLLQSKDNGRGNSRGRGDPTLPPAQGPNDGNDSLGRHQAMNVGDQGVVPINTGRATGPTTIGKSSFSSSLDSLGRTGEQGVSPLNSGKATVHSTVRSAQGSLAPNPLSTGEQGAAMRSSDDTAISPSAMNVGNNHVLTTQENYSNTTNPSSMQNKDSAAILPTMTNTGNAAVSSEPMNTSHAAVSSPAAQSYEEVMQCAKESIERRQLERETPSRSRLVPPIQIEM